MAHDHPSAKAPAAVRRFLAAAAIPFILGTALGLVLLWPSGARLQGRPGFDFPAEIVRAEVTEVRVDSCPGEGTEEVQGGIDCRFVTFLLRDGRNEGDAVTLPMSTEDAAPDLAPGDKVVLGHVPDAPADLQYYFADFERRAPLTILAVLFAVVVVALGRWRGLMALGGLVVTVIILIWFVLPAILEGKDPLLISIVGSSAVMIVALYMAHGVNVRSTTAMLGTFISLILTGALAWVFVEFGQFSGFTSEEALFLDLSAGQVNLKGLLLGGIIIGSLGVLDDVTITQASAVWELHLANPRYGAADLYRSALRIGRDHIASVVNTLLLAYAGASLPLLILFSLANASLGNVVNGEIVAVEVVRTLVGGIGLVASVPVTTGLAALLIGRFREGGPGDDSEEIAL